MNPLETLTGTDLFFVSALSALLMFIMMRPTPYATWCLKQVVSTSGMAYEHPGRLRICSGSWLTFPKVGQRLDCQRFWAMRERIAHWCEHEILLYLWLAAIVGFLLKDVSFLGGWCDCYTAASKSRSWSGLELLPCRWANLWNTCSVAPLQPTP